jgi:uncharacterized protein (DUF302 family)
MEPGNIGNTRVVPAPFDKTLKALRRSLNDAGVSVVRELNLARECHSQPAAGAPRSTLLLVDCPLLLFEALALDRAAAVYIPLHVAISGDQNSACIRWVHPSAATGYRVPATARGPVDALYLRITNLLASAELGAAHPMNGGDDENGRSEA